MQSVVSKIPNWLRWPLTPLVSVVTFFLVSILGNIAAKAFVFLSGDRGIGENFFTFLLVPGFAAYCAVHVAAAVAPSHQKAVALVFASVYVALGGAMLFWVIFGGEYKFIFVVASTCVGAAVAALQEENEFVISKVSG